ncbi:MAG: hypothetical protein V1837_05375, partial [Candidatus Woesearchaeota archaeon]
MKKAFVCIIMFVMLVQFVLAINYGKVSQDDKEAFDEILTPVLRIYNLVKYVASAIAVIFLMFS